MYLLKSIKFQLTIAIIVIFISIAGLLDFNGTSCGLLITFFNLGLDRGTQYFSERSAASAGKSVAMVFINMVMRLSTVVVGLWLGFSYFNHTGVIVGFVLGYLGYISDKLTQIK